MFVATPLATPQVIPRLTTYYGQLDRRLPERKRLNVTSWPHVRGQPQKLCFQVCFQRLNLSLNA